MMHPLPSYARRVEYLEVGLSGTFSVITDFTADTGYIEAKLEAYSTDSFNPNGTRWQYGFRKSGTAIDDAHRLLLYTSTTYTGTNKRWDLGRGVSSPDSRILTSFPGVLNITKRWFNTSGREVPDKFRLFGSTADPPDTIPLRFYYFRFYDPTGNTIAAEFIPCRILDRGYVFDTVSGKFYGNSGTGDFVLGPDVREGVVPTRLNPFGVGMRQEKIRRVEYLESTGTQWIDTGLNADDGLGCDMSMTFLDATMNVNYTFGVLKRTGGTFVRYHASFSSDYATMTMYLGGGTTAVASVQASPGTDEWHRFTYDPQAQTASVDNLSGSTSDLGTWDTGMDFLLFGRQDSNGTIGLSRIRVRYAKFYRNGSIVQDLVPVAIGSVGYLLDRVSGQLFGNQGTGNFVLGPDIVPHLRVWGNGQTSALFDISTPYPLAAGNPVTGTVNGDARSGILDSNLYTVNDAGGNYVGEFIDLTPGGTDSPALRWFDLVAGSPFVGYCEIVQ